MTNVNRKNVISPDGLLVSKVDCGGKAVTVEDRERLEVLPGACRPCLQSSWWNCGVWEKQSYQINFGTISDFP